MTVMNDQDIRVECYSGFKANERPVAFTCDGKRHEIEEIVDRWYEGGSSTGRAVVNYFKVKTTDGSICLLSYRPDSDAWSMRRLALQSSA